MKLLFLTNHLDVGGIETNLVRLTSALTARGHRCIIGARPGPLSRETEAAGGRLVELAMTPGRPGSLVRDAARLRRVLVTERPDVVHVFSASAAVVAWLPLRLVGKRPAIVASIMGLADSPTEPATKVRRRVRTTIIGSDRVVVMAPAIADVVASLGVPAHRLVHDTVVGVEPVDRCDATQRQAIRDSLGLERDAEVVTTIGRLDPRKSHHLFVRAAALVAARRPRAQFLLVGDGALAPSIEAEIDRLGVRRHVRMLGSRRDVTDLLSATDVYVRPGVVEGFIGITVLEAQALQVPVVSFRTEDVQLAIDDGVSGLLAANGDAADLADKIVDLLSDRDRAERIARAGHTRFLERYALGGVVDRLEALYRSLAVPVPSGAA